MPTVADNIIVSSWTNFFKPGSILVATIFVVVLHQNLPTPASTVLLFCTFGADRWRPRDEKNADTKFSLLTTAFLKP